MTLQLCPFFLLLGILLAASPWPQETPDPPVRNPAPGDFYPEDFEYDILGGGKFRLAEFKGQKAVLIANHIMDDPDVSWHPDPFKRLKDLQSRYQDRLAIAIMPELAHHRQQNRAVWEAAARDVREYLDPGDLPVLIETTGVGIKPGHGDHSLYQALNPENLRSWWPMALIDREGRIAWTSRNPHTGNAEHMIYEAELRPAVVRLVDPEGYREWLKEVPHDWVRQSSPWGTLEIEDFERYRDMGDLHVSPCWTNNPPHTYKGELTDFPTRTGYRALALFHSQRAAYVFGYPYYYGYRDPGYGTWAHHTFEGKPRTGTLAFFFAAFQRAAKQDYALEKGKGRGFAFQLEGTEGQKVWLRFGRIGQHPPPGPDDEIAGDIQTGLKWNPDAVWNRLSFHIDPAAGTKIFLDRNFLAEIPDIKGVTGVLFQAGWMCSVDDLVLIPRNLPVDELDEVIRWMDEHALERPHVTPLEREEEIGRLSAGRRMYPRVLRVDWGNSRGHTDTRGDRWLPGQPWLRGTFGVVGGERYVYPPDVQIKGSDAEIYRNVCYSMSRLRFTVPPGDYTLRVHFARPFHWKAAGLPEERVEMEIEPESPDREQWIVNTPYREKAVFEKKNIRVEDGVLDVRFQFRSLVHVAATELIQEAVEQGEIMGIPDWPSFSEAAAGPFR